MLRGLIEADPDDATSRRALASEFARERRFDEARAMYEELVRRAGDDPRKAEGKQAATIELGFIAYLQKDWAQARRILAPVALSGKQVHPRAARILLATDRDSEDYADGLQRAQAFLAAEPRDPEWVAAVAEFQFHVGDKKAAVASLEELGASPDIDRMKAAADAYARLKDFTAAARIAREASTQFPENTEALFRLGSSLERAGDSAAAEKVFLQILALRPNDAPTLNYLGYMWADQGVQLDRAREFLEKAVRREPRNAAYLDSLGWAYFRLGRLDQAQTQSPGGLPARALGSHDRGAHGGPRSEARQPRVRRAPLGKGAGAQTRGARTRPREAPALRFPRHAALSSRAPLWTLGLCFDPSPRRLRRRRRRAGTSTRPGPRTFARR